MAMARAGCVAFALLSLSGCIVEEGGGHEHHGGWDHGAWDRGGWDRGEHYYQ